MAETTRTRGRPGVGNNIDIRSDVRTNMQKAAIAVGLMFLLVGILGFVPGITSHFSDMKFASESSHAKLLGIFEVSVLHNTVHLLFGLAGIAAAKRYASSRNYLIAGGVIYLVLWVYGLVNDKNSTANFVPVNTADNWLHFGLGVGMIALALALADDHRRRNREFDRT